MKLVLINFPRVQFLLNMYVLNVHNNAIRRTEEFWEPVGHIGILGDSLLIIISCRVHIYSRKFQADVETTIRIHYNLLFDVDRGI